MANICHCPCCINNDATRYRQLNEILRRDLLRLIDAIDSMYSWDLPEEVRERLYDEVDDLTLPYPRPRLEDFR